jgi:type IV pilus assembly protein PilW
MRLRRARAMGLRISADSNRPRRARPVVRRAEAGFTLVEIMVALALGMIVVAALTIVFNNASRSRKEVERTGRQIENGHYALRVLADDLKHAGYFAEFKPDVLATPVTKPDPCATDTDSLKAALPLFVQGYDDPTGAFAPTCVSDVRAGTDIVVVRRVSTCVRGAADCDATVAGTPYFQASLCGNATELASTSSGDWYALDTIDANLNRTQRNCTTAADVHRYLTRIYFIANNDVAGDGIPTLKRAELGVGAGGATVFKIVPMVEGVENLQLEYGLDTDNDGAPNQFTPDPDSHACAGSACVANWRNVMAARINLLVRNTEPTPGYDDAKVYTLGRKADGTDNVYPANGAGMGGSYKRHVYQAEVRLNNPAGRRMVR